MALIGVDELAARLARSDANLVICDVRFDLFDHDHGRKQHQAGHLPGAFYVDLHTDLAALDGTSPTGNGRHPLPTTMRFAEFIGALGIGTDTFVVAYDDVGGAFASRLWWMLRAIGHDHVAVLDGGYRAWVRTGYDLDRSTPHPVPTTHPAPASWPGVVTADDVARAVDEGRPLIDARAPERFGGHSEPLDARAGHIPGAINIHHASHLDDDGTHLPVADLRDHFAGIEAGQSPIAYCGSGVSACHNLLVMCILGIAEPGEAYLYPGSWSEWAADPIRPIATDA